MQKCNYMARTVALLSLIVVFAGCLVESQPVGPPRGGFGGDGGSGASGGVAGSGGMGGESGAGGAAGVGGIAGTGGAGGSAPGCSLETEEVDCPLTSCNPLTQMCSKYAPESRNTCDACQTDADCRDSDHRCVEMFYDGSRFPDAETGFCLRIADGSGGNCDSPYAVRIEDRPSVSGAPLESYCGIAEDLTTCDAVRAMRSGDLCGSGEDAECPTGGLCREIDEFIALRRCTYQCDDTAQCAASFGEPICNGYCDINSN